MASLSRSYTIAGAMRASGLSRATIARAVQCGDLPAERLHGFAIIDSDDLSRWQTAREGHPRAAPRPRSAAEDGR